MNTTSRCPVVGPIASAKSRHTAAGSMSNADWWPNQLNLRILHTHAGMPGLLGKTFDYAVAFNTLDFYALKTDLSKFYRKTLYYSAQSFPAGLLIVITLLRD